MRGSACAPASCTSSCEVVISSGVAVLFVIVLLFDSGLIGRTVKNVFNRGKKQRGEAEKNA